mgnify:CR=1 FL=1
MYFKEYLNMMLDKHQKTQKEVAELEDVNCDPSLVSYWCSGDRKCTDPKKRKAIVNFFAKTPTEFKQHLFFIYTGKKQ